MITIDINKKSLNFEELNKQIKATVDENITINGCIGQRYIGSGLKGKNITINGIPGNALGSYLDGSFITVNGNAQDETGDTMNDGAIYIHGSSGDATGYAMRGGKIFIRDNAGYRAGIHMKEYKEKKPILIIGGYTGSFLGEYQAGGLIIVLGLNSNGNPPVGNFCGTGMHGGKIYLRCDKLPSDLPKQVVAKEAAEDDLKEIEKHINEFCNVFTISKEAVMSHKFFVLIPDTKNPYKQLYINN
ncbi:MAG: glutamate synthase alpha subunit domain protein [Clostridia bacterium]|jgi:glutamate synthase domain-containing protein 3|nr:glutamate synthase alpha subunit domain protein [Clostridia bacterium]